ncbi:MAG: hypothetical protein QNJ54_20875 [Prochloraceae cyanobacterium]|nr:hypothetical protein [Prochloraceae cyanobacterium]
MKSLIRWGATLGIVGSTVLGSILTQTLQAVALPVEQILPRLETVPVFTITNEQGYFLTASEGEKKFTGVFISQKDASSYIEQLKKDKPDLGKLKVLPLSLSQVYQLARDNAKKENGLSFIFQPTQAQVELAQKIPSSNGQNQQFLGVPLFYATVGEGKHLPAQRNNQQVFPFFFEKSQLEKIVEDLKQKQPQLASTLKIEVISLEAIIINLEKSNDENLTKIHLEPTAESVEFVMRSLRENNNQRNNQTNTDR